MERKKKLPASIKLLCIVCTLLSPCSDASKGLKSFIATMGDVEEAGSNDNVRVQLLGGIGGGTCTTGVIYHGLVYDSWSEGDTEEYSSTKQDFGTCNNFDANKSKVDFMIMKDGSDGLLLIRMKFHIGDETYLWEGNAEWDPSHPAETANCIKGNCLPVNCVLSEWGSWSSSCSTNCTFSRIKTITREASFGGTCPEREALEQTKICTGKIPGTNQTCPIKKEDGGSKSTGAGPGGPIAAVLVFLLVVAVCFIIYKKRKSTESKLYYGMSPTEYKPTTEYKPAILVVKKDQHVHKNIKTILDNKAGQKDKLKHKNKYAAPPPPALTEEVTKSNNTVVVANKINKEHNRFEDQKPVAREVKPIGKLSIPAAFGGPTTDSSSTLLPPTTIRRSSFSDFSSNSPPITFDLHTSIDHRRYSETTIIEAVKSQEHDKHFLTFGKSEDMMEILGIFESLCKTASISPGSFNEFFSKFKFEFVPKVPHKYLELLRALEEKAKGLEYMENKAAEGKRVLIIGGGPAGLRMAIEAQLLGATTIVLEKRNSINRNNVVKLWTFVMEDLKLLGAKKLYPALGNGSVNHVSIRILQLILLKISLLLGTEVRCEATYSRIIEPEKGDSWRVVSTREGKDSVEEFDVVIGATGRTGKLEGFQRKSLDAKLAIAITANFVNSKSAEERAVQEIPGLSKQYDQEFFRSLETEEGIVLENIVYYKDETHYFVMTATKETLLKHKVIISDNKPDRQSLLQPDNIDTNALEKFAIQVATTSTKLKSKQLPTTTFAQWKGKKDVSIFDFTNLYASSNACHIKERKGQVLLQAIVGDSLVQPFWPEGTGIGKAFLSVLDTAWMIKNFSLATQTTLELIREREMLYSQLKHTGDKDVRSCYAAYSINPKTRYSTNNCTFHENRIAHLYDTDAKSK